MFDRFASAVSSQVARAWFFALCVLLIVVWAPSIFFIKDVDTWQLIINTLTTIITFLLVALLQNEQDRFERGTNERLDTISQQSEDILRELQILNASQLPNPPKGGRQP